MKKTIAYLFILVGLIIFAVSAYLRTQVPLTDEQQRSFKVEDMSILSKVSLKDRDGNQTNLIKEDGVWQVEGKGDVNKIMLNDLFYALEFMDAEYAVPAAARENVVTQMITKSTKVGLYKNGKSKPYKEFTVGGPNHTQDGTFMLMELDGQIADKPYVVKLPGFKGYITYRFSAITNYWISKEFVKYLPNEIATVKMTYFNEDKDQSYQLDRKDGVFSLKEGATSIPEEKLNLDMANGIYATLMDLNFEEYIDSIPGQDTVLTNLHYADFEVKTIEGKEHKVKIYFKPLPQISNTPRDSEGNFQLYDVNKLYAYNENDDTYFTIQYFTFGNLFVKADELKQASE